MKRYQGEFIVGAACLFILGLFAGMAHLWAANQFAFAAR